MEFRQLGGSGFKVPVLSLGTGTSILRVGVDGGVTRVGGTGLGGGTLRGFGELLLAESDHATLATLAHGGRTIATYDIVISDSAGRRVCTSRLTCLIRDRVPAGAANGTGLEGEQGVNAD